MRKGKKRRSKGRGQKLRRVGSEKRKERKRRRNERERRKGRVKRGTTEERRRRRRKIKGEGEETGKREFVEEGRGRGTYLALLVKPLGTNVGQRYATKKRNEKGALQEKDKRVEGKREAENNG